jgi:hypothetical protein
MTDKNVCNVAYLLNTEAIGLIAVATDSYFEEKLGTSFQVQLSDLDVEISNEYIDHSAGLIPLDVGGIAVIETVKNLLITLGCKDELFRTMTVNGKRDTLWQVKAPGTYVLLNEELEPAIDSSVYRGPIDDIPLELAEISGSPMGCLRGREDYQELVFSKEVYDGLLAECDVSDFFIGQSLYGNSLKNAVSGDFDLIPSGTFENCNAEYLDLLRSKELMALLEYASTKSIAPLGNETYKRLKVLKLPLGVKKEAMKLYKGLKVI